MSLLSRYYLSAALLLLAAGCRQDAKPAPATAPGPQSTRVTLALNWFPEAEHGGFYAAREAGYFAEEGLDVRIIPGGPNVPVIQNVARGQAMFGVATADQILLGRAAGAAVIALLAPLQNSPRCILVHEESGIASLAELKDVTLAMRTGIAFSEFLKSKVPLENVKIVPYTGNVSQFLLDKRYAQQAYVFSEPFVAEQQGAKTRSLLVSDLGYNPYTSLLFASDQLVQQNPKLVKKMTRACQRGWQKYLEDATAANNAIHAANPDMSLAALQYGAQALQPLCLLEGVAPQSLGHMTHQRWQTLADQLIEIKLLEPGKVKVEEAFSSEFLHLFRSEDNSPEL
jgi:NitT/TauT family transport system substrate-binding protein